MITKELMKLPVADLVPYENNPRVISPEAVNACAESMRQCSALDPIEVDENNVILSGHTRRLAMMQLGVETADVVRYTGLTEEQKQKYRILANKTGEMTGWDFGKLEQELAEVDFGDFDFDFDLSAESMAGSGEEKQENPYGNKTSGALAEKYIAPPFSVIDCCSGTWQNRKNKWNEILSSKEGRDTALLGKGLDRLAQVTSKTLSGTSMFDPVLAETMLAWFCPEGGWIIDPFAGGSVRGLVTAYTGRKYVGMDLSQRQITANEDNYERLKDTSDFYGNPLEHPTWICGDSSTIDVVCKDKGKFDFLLTCPPYADLEKYSDDPKDLSNMEYSQFIEAYRDIIRKATSLLKDNAFAVCVVGEVRSKSGAYYNFVSDTIQAFIDAGMDYYNEIILRTALATAALRAENTFGAKRKVVKVHQNVLVFVKGDPAKITLEPYQYDFDAAAEDTSEEEK